MKFKKRDIDRVKNMTEEELKKFQEDYEILTKNIGAMSTPGLILLSVVGIAITLFFQSNIMDFIGLVIFAYPFYILIQREGHKGGFFDGYYQILKGDKKTNKTDPKK